MTENDDLDDDDLTIQVQPIILELHAGDPEIIAIVFHVEARLVLPTNKDHRWV